MTDAKLLGLQEAIQNATLGYHQYTELHRAAEGATREHYFKIAQVFYTARKELIGIQAIANRATR